MKLFKKYGIIYKVEELFTSKRSKKMTLHNLRMAAREAALKLREINSLKLEYKEALDAENPLT